jgi:hypothetical protein
MSNLEASAGGLAVISVEDRAGSSTYIGPRTLMVNSATGDEKAHAAAGWTMSTSWATRNGN